MRRSVGVNKGAVAVAIGALALLPACGDDGGGDAAPANRRSASALLAQVPRESRDGDGPIQLQYGDVIAATALAGVDRPSDLDDDQELFRWLRPLTGFSLEDDETALVALSLPELVQPNKADQQADFRDEMGWSVLDIDAFIASDRPPSRLLVIQGSVDTDEVDKAAGPANDGVWQVGDGDDFSINAKERTIARPLGQPLHEATHNGLFAVSTSSATIDSWVGGGESMADDPGFRAVAAALDRGGVYTAFMLSADGDGDAVNPFDTIAVGMTVEEDTPVAYFVYHYADAATAKLAATTIAEILEGSSLRTNAPWSEFFAASNIVVEDDVVVAILPLVEGRQPGGIVNILFAQDNLTSRG